jgi:hypothetical protein
LAFAHVPAGNVGGDDVRVVAFEQYGRGLYAGDHAGSGAIAAVDQKTVFIDDDGMNESPPKSRAGA